MVQCDFAQPPVKLGVNLRFTFTMLGATLSVSAIIVCPMQCMALGIKSLECMSVYLSEIRIVLDSIRSFCPIFLKFGT